ncbi:MAG: hypothetical protein SGPRY_002656 [Prymnesium sp.]
MAFFLATYVDVEGPVYATTRSLKCAADYANPPPAIFQEQAVMAEGEQQAEAAAEYNEGSELRDPAAVNTIARLRRSQLGPAQCAAC